LRQPSCAADQRLGDDAVTDREGFVRYPISALYADYLRAAFGLALTAGPLLLLELATVVAALLAVLGVLFAWFAMRTVLRHLSRVELSGNAIALCGPIARRLAWDDLERLKLAYYAPRRSRDDGWMQLTLQGSHGRPIQLDSTLAGFDQVLCRASRAASATALSMDAATHANLAALGLAAAGDPASATAPVSSPAPERADGAPAGPRTRW
jgi:HAMP domain-containing protein